jgi:hypothetical protein
MRFKETHFLWLVCAVVALFGSLGCGPAPVQESSTHKESARETRAERPSESQASAERYDLGRDEERGGHTLKKHVARTDEQLQVRLERERNISAASTWSDRETAETVVAEALVAEHGRIEKWSRRGYPRANLALHYDAGRAIGRSLRRGEVATVDCTSAVIVLRADGPDSFYVLTTYPEARE